MNSDPGSGSPILVSAFRTALLQQSLVVALIFAVLLIAWGVTRTAVYGPRLPGARAAGTGAGTGPPRGGASPARGSCCGSGSGSSGYSTRSSRRSRRWPAGWPTR